MNNPTCEFFEKGIDLPCKFYIRPTDRSEPGFCKLEDEFVCVEAAKVKWCWRVCSLTEAMSKGCKVKIPCPKWAKKGGDGR